VPAPFLVPGKFLLVQLSAINPEMLPVVLFWPVELTASDAIVGVVSVAISVHRVIRIGPWNHAAE
jgi:hypothetical protein